MADKKIIEEAIKKGAFESPVGEKVLIAGARVDSVKSKIEVTIGEAALNGLRQLGVNVDRDGTMSMKAYDTVSKQPEKTEEER